MKVENLSLICIPFTLDSVPMPLPRHEVTVLHLDHHGEAIPHESECEYYAAWAGLAA